MFKISLQFRRRIVDVSRTVITNSVLDHSVFFEICIVPKGYKISCLFKFPATEKEINIVCTKDTRLPCSCLCCKHVKNMKKEVDIVQNIACGFTAENSI